VNRFFFFLLTKPKNMQPTNLTAHFYCSNGRFTIQTSDNRFMAHFVDKTIEFVDFFGDLLYCLEALGYECFVIDSLIEG
jgi:hypothetical protein